jgi:site-specific DNA recombinase
MEKVRRGGTVNKAPIGYLNVRHVRDGREVRTVEVDEVRGPLITWAFDAYATGEWSLTALTDALVAEGLTTVPSAQLAEKPIPRATLHRLLRNPYYTGLVVRHGVTYPGTHEPLVAQDVFDKVQSVLESHNVAGGRDRVHNHYLKGSVYCRQCGGRLCITKTRNRHGTEYLYFFCLANYRRTRVCQQRAISVDLVEARIEDKWAHVQFDPEYAELFRQLIEEQMEVSRNENRKIAARAERRLGLLSEEKEKLLRAHYADAVPLDLMKKEQARIGAEVATLERKLEAASANFEILRIRLEKCLDLLANCHEAYLTAPPHIRRLMNQAVFEKFLVDMEGSSEAVPTDLFGVLLRPDFVMVVGQTQHQIDDDQSIPVHRNSDWANGLPSSLVKVLRSRATSQAERTGSQTRLRTHRRVGLNKKHLAEGVGFEPTEACTSRLFKSRAFVRSAIPPGPRQGSRRPKSRTDDAGFRLDLVRSDLGLQLFHPLERPAT